MNRKYFVLGALMAMGIAAGRVSAQMQDETSPPATAPSSPSAAATTRPGVTVVNIHLKQALPEDVFDELAKQGGIEFPNGANLWQTEGMQAPKDVDLTDRPFWPAVREVCGLWNVSIQPNFGNDSGRRFMLIPTGLGQGRVRPQALPACESDGFVIEAVSFSRQLSVNYGRSGSSLDICNVHVRVYIDPALHVENSNPSVKTQEATDDAGNSMVPDNNNNNRMFYGGNMQQPMIYECGIPLKYPDKPGKSITLLKGSLQLQVGDKLDSLTVDKPLEAAETSKTFGDTTVTFHSLKKMGQGNGYQMSISVSRDNNNDRNPNEFWNLLQSSTQLLDDQGKAFNFAGLGGGPRQDEWTVNYARNGGDVPQGEPAKWVISLPMDLHLVDIPFEFKDLPLP